MDEVLIEMDIVDLGNTDSTLLKSFEASLQTKKGVFVIRNLEAFEREFSLKLIGKHTYISPGKWIFLSQSLKNKIHALNFSEISGLEEEKSQAAIKNLFSD